MARGPAAVFRGFNGPRDNAKLDIKGFGNRDRITLFDNACIIVLMRSPAPDWFEVEGRSMAPVYNGGAEPRCRSDRPTEARWGRNQTPRVQHASDDGNVALAD